MVLNADFHYARRDKPHNSEVGSMNLREGAFNIALFLSLLLLLLVFLPFGLAVYLIESAMRGFEE